MDRFMFEYRRAGLGGFMRAIVIVIAAAGGMFIGYKIFGDHEGPPPADVATAALLSACPGLRVHAADLTMSAPAKRAADFTVQRERGWTEVEEIVVKVSDRPSRRISEGMKASGQQCYFAIGSDAKTIAISKRPCMALCADLSLDQVQGKPYIAYFSPNGTAQYMQP